MSQHESAPARPLYDEVERIRLRNGWTRVQLAKKAGVGRNTIDNWRTQPRAPLAPTVKDVAERLGINVDLALRLAGITGEQQSVAASASQDLAEQLAERIRWFEEDNARRQRENDERIRRLEDEVKRLKEQRSG